MRRPTKTPVLETRPNLDPDDKEQEKDNEELYGMGRGLLGNKQGDKDVETSLGSYLKDPKTGVGLTEPVEPGQGAVGEITKLITRRPRADDAPGAIVPYRRDEALLGIIGEYGKRLSEAPVAILELCASLLRDVQDERRFTAIRNHFESLGIKNMPTWEEAQKAPLAETYAGFLGIGGGNRIASDYPMDRPGAATPGFQKRADKGFTFYIPKPPSRARREAGKQNAKVVGGTSGGMHSRMARARHVLDTLKKDRRKDAGKKNGDRMRGSAGPNFRNAGASNRPMMHLAAGKYAKIDDGKVVLKEGYPTLSDGMPWFHGTVSRNPVGGVPALIVKEGHVICSGVLPRPKFTEGIQVWDAGCPLGAMEMEIAFAQLTEGMESVRPWHKKKGDVSVIGLPTEGLIVRHKGEVVEFLSFDSKSGFEALQEWLIWACPEVGGRRAIEESVTYGYVRAGASDLILDRVIRKLNRMNILDVFEDALFDKASEALYVLMSPMLSESEIQEVAVNLQSEYPEIKILGGPMNENVDWWVLYIPKPGSNSSPELDKIFEPSISRPLDVSAPDVVTQAIQQIKLP